MWNGEEEGCKYNKKEKEKNVEANNELDQNENSQFIVSCNNFF